MAEIKWIKITTSMFDDEKIDFIESMPEADTILICWIKLLTLAGKSNMGGHIMLTESIPYTVDMLAHKFKRSLSTVKMAMETFVRLGMITMEDGTPIYINNWEKHQNIDGMERVREQNRLRKQQERERKKLLGAPSSDDVSQEVSRDSHNDVACDKRESHATDIDKEKDIKNIRVHSSEYTPAFEAFWSHYPRKKEKRKAFAAWKTRLREPDVTEELLIICAQNYATFVKREGTEERYIKHGATFLGPSKPYEEYSNVVQMPNKTSQQSSRPRNNDALEKARSLYNKNREAN